MKVRIANNKNIQTMGQKDIDIYEILKDEEYGTELYTPICGRVWHSGMANDKDSAKAIWTEDEDGREHFFDKNGKVSKEGEVLLFPSKEMRDWSKFFKKGDVLEFVGDEKFQGTCVFEKYEDDTKTRFIGRYTKEKEAFNSRIPSHHLTVDWVKCDDPAGYIKTIEERLGGKLNLETLEIEKPEKIVFEIGKLYVFNEEDEDGELTVIGKLVGKNEIEDGALTFGYQYEIENENFVTNETLYLNIGIHKELREATENEVELFNKHCAIWEKKEKEAMEQPTFKPFDKVLVRSGRGFNWYPALFVRDRGENSAKRYTALPIHIGTAVDFTSCIPFEGHENFAFTDYDIVDLPF
nr:MAG TPA: hypothetical protein [Caudoviricetes sp.]